MERLLGKAALLTVTLALIGDSLPVNRGGALSCRETG
jgi:hypothetical protein